MFAPVRLNVLENGRVIGTTEGGRSLTKPGEHTLELVSEQIGFRETRNVDAKPGEVVALTIELPAAARNEQCLLTVNCLRSRVRGRGTGAAAHHTGPTVSWRRDSLPGVGGKSRSAAQANDGRRDR